jgi:glycosyltransferase involved in cell wall biosynthesis
MAVSKVYNSHKRSSKTRRPREPAGKSKHPWFSHKNKVLMVAPQPFFDDRGTPIALRHVINALSEIGYKIDIVTYPLGRDLDIPNVRIYRTPNPLRFKSIPVGFSLKKVFLDLFLFKLFLKLLRHDQYGCVHAVEEAAFMAVFPKRRYNFQFLYDMQSSLPEHLATRKFFRIKPIQKICNTLEKWLLSKADHVTCSAGLSAHVRYAAPNIRPHEWIFPATRSYINDNEVIELRNELKLHDKSKIIVYSGTFAKYQGLPILIKAIPKVAADNSDVIFILVGATKQMDVEMVKRQINPAFEKNVRILSRVPKNRLSCFLELADILISTRIQSGNLPVKVFEYLASGKPIVATDIPAHRSVLSSERAVLVKSTPDEFAKAIISLLEDPGRIAHLSESSKKFAERNLSWDKFVKSVSQIYSQFHN